MTEDEAATELLRRQALADAAEARAQFEADRPAREARADEAMVERWRARQAPRPVRRAPEAPQRREMSPPWPDKLQVVKHDPATGRAIGIATYENAMSIKSALGWESYVEGVVAAAEARTRQYVARYCENLADVVGEVSGRDQGRAKSAVKSAVETLAEEVGRDTGKLDKQLAALAATVERLAQRIDQMEARAAPPPRLVEMPDAAAD